MEAGPLPGDVRSRTSVAPPIAARRLPRRRRARPPERRFRGRAPGRRGPPRAPSRIRSRFGALGRTESVLFDFRRRDGRREVLLGILLTGTRPRRRAPPGRGRSAPAVPSAGAGGSPRDWRMSSASLGCRLEASASDPLFEEVAEAAGLSRPSPGVPAERGAERPDPGRAHAAGRGRPRLRRRRPARTSSSRAATETGCTATAATAPTRTWPRAPASAGRRAKPSARSPFDYDNDGRTDLYVTYLFRPNLLYRNRGDGTFEEIGDRAGVALDDYSTSAAALDYDLDGMPDLYVLVYGHPDHGPNIQANNAPPNHLFHNNGDGTFTDVTKAARTGDTGWALALESRRLRRRRLARHLRRERLRQERLPPQRRRRHLPDRAAGRASSTPASGWASRSTTPTATACSTSTSPTTPSR